MNSLKIFNHLPQNSIFNIKNFHQIFKFHNGVHRAASCCWKLLPQSSHPSFYSSLNLGGFFSCLSQIYEKERCCDCCSKLLSCSTIPPGHRKLSKSAWIDSESPNDSCVELDWNISWSRFHSTSKWRVIWVKSLFFEMMLLLATRTLNDLYSRPCQN